MLASGTNLGPYELLEQIGSGGMGEVYKARGTRLNRMVAVKVLPQHVAQNAEHKQRFVREAQAIAALNHPNICVVHDVGADSRTHYLLRVSSLNSKETRQLLTADSLAVYSNPGYLLFVRKGTLMAQAFDAARLELSGEAFRVAENVRFDTAAVGIGIAPLSVSDTGTLVYREGANLGALKTVWLDRTGKELEPINQTGDSRNARLSPNDSMIVVNGRLTAIQTSG